MPTPLSGYFLEADGWKKEGFTWKKRLDTITYDGCSWVYYKFPDCIKMDNYGVNGVRVIPIRISNTEDLKDKK